MATLTGSTTVPRLFEDNGGSLNLDQEGLALATPDLEKSKPVMLNASKSGASQPITSGAKDLIAGIWDTMPCVPEQFLPATTNTTATQPDRADTTPSTSLLTRPKRHAAVKALHSLSAAYQPLIIHAAQSERSSSVASAEGDASNPEQRREGTSSLLVIDDMLPPPCGSEGDSDAYGSTMPRKRRQTRTGEKRKRGRADAEGGSVRLPRCKKRVEKLDRDDLRLIARAAQGLLGGEETRSIVKKRKRVVLLDALKKAEAERLVRFVEDSLDWGIAAARVSEVTVGPSNKGSTAEAEVQTTSLEVADCNPHSALSDILKCENTMTAERLRSHWKNVLGSRIVSMYLD